MEKAIIKTNTSNKGAEYIAKVCNLVYLAGFPNFWVEDLNYSQIFVKFFSFFTKFINVILYAFIISEWAAFFTQHDLTEKQRSDRLLFNYSHPILFSYRLVLTHHEKKIKEMVSSLFVKLKEAYNDEKVEKAMIRKSKVFSIVFLSICNFTLLLYGFDGLWRAVRADATFTTIIPGWPDVNDKSFWANFVRIVAYVIWWVFMTRVYGSYSLVLCLMVALEYQYKNLRKYFFSLNRIFDMDLSQSEKEAKYEEDVKVGIQMHSDTLRCFQLAQDTCSTIYCLQILLNISVIVSLMTQMVDPNRSVGVVVTIVSTASAILICTGVFMWTAGDVTVEASYLATAMHGSGWQNCFQRAVSVRALLTLAMMQAQKPVELKGLGFVTISYSAYLTIVRSSYSIFTVLY